MITIDSLEARIIAEAYHAFPETTVTVCCLTLDNGYAVMPCDSRGEGPNIADYCVGLNTGHLREGGDGPVGNRFLQIEAELGSRAKFAGRNGFKPNGVQQRG